LLFGNTMDDNVTNEPRRILVIDDNESILEDFRTTLTRAVQAVDLSEDENALFGQAKRKVPRTTFRVDCASQGKQGYEMVLAALAADSPYQLAFVDMRMPPGWDGVQTIQKLWEADPQLHVVICSAYSAYSWKQISDTLGASDRLLVLKKPFDELEVFQIANSQTAKWLATQKANLKRSELEGLVEERTAELKRTALVDQLTGLPNRRLLTERLTQLIQAAKRDPNRKFAALFLDFDRFKIVNDSLGHEIGDLLIMGIAERLCQATRATDTIATLSTTARLGGDEFIIVLDQLNDHPDCVRVAKRLIESLAQPHILKGHTVYSTASIGMTTSAINYNTADEMIRDADIAMYRAKAAGNGCYMMFDSRMHEEAMRRLTLEIDMHDAVSRGEFQLLYQPIISLLTEDTIGFEALIRWNHPKRGMVSPTEFIPIAEEIGAIVPIGYWVLDEACRQLSEWRKQGTEFADISVSVNLSRKQLSQPDLVSFIESTLKKHSLSPADLKLEITESAIMKDPEDAVRVLHDIRRADVDLHMDDFGTGYSSLSCIHRFPIGGLKIDRSFVSNMLERHDYALVIDSIISLTHKLNLRLVAEGVETEEQLILLKSMNCKMVQGYYFAKPLTPAAASAFLKTKLRFPPPLDSKKAARLLEVAFRAA
jgi:diguanylate cyclase